jgi:predicted nucleotidyltransferase
MSLFDEPKENLNTDLFDEDGKLHSKVRMYLLSLVNQAFPNGLIVKVYLLGSMAGRRYNEFSDIDLNLILKPGFHRRDYKEQGKIYNGTILPGTRHPITLYTQNYTDSNFADAEYAVYNVTDNVWAVNPKEYKNLRMPKEEFRDELRFAKHYSKIFDYNHNDQDLFDFLEKKRKMSYGFGWGTPRESQQNILYKYIEKNIKPKHKNEINQRFRRET